MSYQDIQFNSQYVKVEQLELEMLLLESQYKKKKIHFQNEMKKLQEICQHDFLEELYHDYHKSYYYSVCNKCNFIKR